VVTYLAPDWPLKRPTQGDDMESQVAILDRDIWPDSRDQPLLADNFAGAFDKNDKKCRTPEHSDELGCPPSQHFCALETSEMDRRNKVRSRGGLFVSHLHSLNSFGGRNVELLRVRENFYIFEKKLFSGHFI
jgi:hypothetical protein